LDLGKDEGDNEEVEKKKKKLDLGNVEGVNEEIEKKRENWIKMKEIVKK
jgi:hypothetical protein